MTTSVSRAGGDFLAGVVVAVGFWLVVWLVVTIARPWVSGGRFVDRGDLLRTVSGAEASKAGARSVLVTGAGLILRETCRDACDDLNWAEGALFVKLSKDPAR